VSVGQGGSEPHKTNSLTGKAPLESANDNTTSGQVSLKCMLERGKPHGEDHSERGKYNLKWLGAVPRRNDARGGEGPKAYPPLKRRKRAVTTTGITEKGGPFPKKAGKRSSSKSSFLFRGTMGGRHPL